MTTILNFGGKGNLNQYTFRNIPPTVSSTYDTEMIVEYVGNVFTFTLKNSVIVSVSMTAYLNPNPPTGVWKSFIASRNEINYTFNFSNNYQTCKVYYTGSLRNAVQFATIENYKKLLTNYT